jgi:hypothetical protein
MKLILNDNIECLVTINYRKTNIDGQRIPLFTNKKFKCSYRAVNQIAFNIDRVETIANGIIRINGDILTQDYDVYDGEVTIFNSKHDIIKINRCRNLLDSRIVDFTELVIE